MKIFLSFFFLFSTLSFSQTKKIVYIAKVNEVNTEISAISKFINTETYEIEGVNFELTFNDTLMKFKGINNSVTNLEFNDILDICDSHSEYYKFNKSEAFFNRENDINTKRDYILKSEYKIDWKIFEFERKTILGFECQKAEGILAIDYGEGNIIETYPIEAWFTTQLNYNYGPKAIGNLSGIILELKQIFVTFEAEKIETTKEKLDNTFLNENEILSPFEFMDYKSK
jgi:GLPGLI family protein